MSDALLAAAVRLACLALNRGASYVTSLLRGRGPTLPNVADAIRRLGLEPGFYPVVPVTGRVDGATVRISEHVQPEERTNGAGPELLVEVVDELAVPLRVAGQALLPDLLRGADLLTGEPRFDDRVRVDAPDPLPALAMLDADTRDALGAAVDDGAGYDGRRWSMRVGRIRWDGERLAKAVRKLVRAHTALRDAAARASVEGLAAIAASDRHAGVRHRALTLLVERGIAPRALLESRTTDLDPGVRYLAARALGADGVGALRAIVETGSRTWRVRAAAALATVPLAPEVVRQVEGTLAAALADPELADPALLGLARVGTARSIEPLQRLVAEGATADLRRAARDVLEQVRGRLDPAQAGGLSLVEGERGRLSEPPADRGHVSVAVEREG